MVTISYGENNYFLPFESSKLAVENSSFVKANIKSMTCLMNREGYKI